MHFPHLDPRTRTLMLEEIKYDTDRNKLYSSPRLTPLGKANYPQFLEEAARAGSDATLATRLQQPGQFVTMEPRGRSMAKVPSNAAEMLAEGEFNRFYIRALCRRANDDGVDELVVTRAKPVTNPRPESEAKIGTAVDPHRLLTDLRNNVGMDTVLGLPAGPNSGLSVSLPSHASKHPSH